MPTKRELEETLAERDATIATLTAAVAERDASVSALEETVGERDITIAGLDEQLEELKGAAQLLEEQHAAAVAEVATLREGAETETPEATLAEFADQAADLGRRYTRCLLALGVKVSHDLEAKHIRALHMLFSEG